MKSPVAARPAAAERANGPAETADGATSLAAYPDVVAVPAPSRDRRRPWSMLVLAAVAMFVGAMGSITVFEAIAGRPVAALTGAGAGAGTTIGRAIGEQDPVTDPQPTTDPTEAPSPSPTATVEPSPDPTGTTPPPTSTTPTTTGPTTPPSSETPSTPPTGP